MIYKNCSFFSREKDDFRYEYLTLYGLTSGNESSIRLSVEKSKTLQYVLLMTYKYMHASHFGVVCWCYSNISLLFFFLLEKKYIF